MSSRAARPPSPGIQLHTVRKLMDRDAAGTLAALRKIGYREVKLAGLHGRNAREVRGLLDDAGLTAPAGHVSAEDLRGRSGALLEEAALLGQAFVICGGADREWLPDNPAIDDAKRLAAILNAAGSAVRSVGLRFGYHNHAGDHFAIGATTLYDVLLEECDPGLVALELDVFWSVRGGRDPVADLDRHAERFPLLHLKDMDARGDMADVGSGVLDFSRILEAAGRSGTAHRFVEHDHPASPLGSAAASHRFLSGLGISST